MHEMLGLILPEVLLFLTIFALPIEIGFNQNLSPLLGMNVHERVDRQ